MRETVRDRERLEHIQAAIDNIFQYTDGKTFQQLQNKYVTLQRIFIKRQLIWQTFHHFPQRDRYW